jgi:hypothetical protein
MSIPASSELNQTPERYAVVTGASRGLGKSFAEELARRGIPTVLISSNPAISDLCHSIRQTYHTQSECVVADLTREEEVLAAASEINDKYEVFLLVNNAGLGGSQAFEKTDVEYIRRILHLNVMATSLLTHQLLPNLLRQGRSFILNVSSLVALTPVGYKMVYPASKAFVNTFSFGLRAEFCHRGLSVSIVSPGAMATSEGIRKRIEKQGFFGRLTLVPPEKVARKSITQTLRGKKDIVVNPLSHFFQRILPDCIKTPLLTRVVRREISQS